MVHCRTPSNRNVHGKFLLSTVRKQRQRLVRRSAQLLEKTHTEHAKLTPTTFKKMKKLENYFRKLAKKLMVDTKQVCCGETTANFTITDSTPNAILHPCCNALTKHLIYKLLMKQVSKVTSRKATSERFLLKNITKQNG